MDAPTTKAGRDDRAVEAADEEAQAPAEGAGGRAMDVDAEGRTGGGGDDEGGAPSGPALVLKAGSRQATVEPRLACRLGEHQRAGVQWMYAAYHGAHRAGLRGGILGDGMGMGKTGADARAHPHGPRGKAGVPRPRARPPSAQGAVTRARGSSSRQR